MTFDFSSIAYDTVKNLKGPWRRETDLKGTPDIGQVLRNHPAEIFGAVVVNGGYLVSLMTINPLPGLKI
jgi:hypothetical protein